jgi:hypothetical protein
MFAFGLVQTNSSRRRHCRARVHYLAKSYSWLSRCTTARSSPFTRVRACMCECVRCTLIANREETDNSNSRVMVYGLSVDVISIE